MDYKKDLLAKLPQLKNIEGFPIGKDEDIIALSQPPYYTACPNPYIEDFIKEHGTPYNEETDDYHCEPFVADISEGKSDPIYMAHTYHTKVPYKAIAKYIEHYTKEGDIILDGFSGSGMAGVASQSCGRNAIISDLAPIGYFIGFNLNNHIDVAKAFEEASRVLKEVENETKEFYQTNHANGIKGKINYVIWSDVLNCNYCNSPYVFWDNAVVDNTIYSNYECPSCKANINKSTSKRASFIYFDSAVNRTLETVKQIPVLINYTVGRKSYIKKLDENDLAVIQKIEKIKIPFWFPIDEIPNGVKTSEPKKTHNYNYIHQYFTYRNLYVISALLEKAEKSKYPYFIKFLLTSFITKTGSKLHNIGMKNGNINLAGAMPNTLFVPSLFAERNIFKLAKGKLKDIATALSSKSNFSNSKVFSQVCSVTQMSTIPDNSIDYVFTDPPFGDNLMYSELSFIWEGWLKVKTNNEHEAIINTTQNKELDDYYHLMLNAFKEYYRVLKPKRWITVEFHNSKSSVWNSIQEALAKAGFIIAQVTILDKKQGTYNQMTASGAVKSDLAISAFKPSLKFNERILRNSGRDMELDFVDQFLNIQPIKVIVERTEKMLYSKMLAFYVQNGYEIRYDAKSFYSLLHSNFIQEDGFWFTASQINSYLEYKKQQKLEGIDEVKSGEMFLFVTDEKSALVWLYNFLSVPKSFSDISVAFNQTANIQGDNVPELRELLEQNFIFENNKYRRPQSEPEHNQLVEKREKQLMREFETLLIQAKTEKKKIKEIRKEALVFGFETCYKNKRYQDIITLAGKLHNSILENNGDLNDFVQASEIMTSGIM